jgi:proteasome lid subunit RPN8/RPN11
MSKSKKANKVTLRISAEVARAIRQHARSNSKTEVCGVLIGSDADSITTIQACISGANAAQGGTHVTFTQDTWEHIYKIKDRDYPNERIVGWYHSHPGFGVFLSDHDTFIHQNFFSSPRQVAWVYDPHSDEEGCFGWQDERLERLERFSVVDSKGGELAGASGRPEPRIGETSDSTDWEQPVRRADREDRTDEDADLSRLARTVSAVFSHLAVFLLGGLLVWYLLPRILVMPVPVDPKTGQPIHDLRDLPSARPDAQAPNQNPPDTHSPAGQQQQPDPNNSQRGDVHR